MKPPTAQSRLGEKAAPVQMTPTKVCAAQSTERPRQKPAATHVVATSTYVISPRSGLGRYLLTWRCPSLSCGSRHLSTVRVLTAELTRSTPRVGRTVLHVAGVEVAA